MRDEIRAQYRKKIFKISKRNSGLCLEVSPLKLLKFDLPNLNASNRPNHKYYRPFYHNARAEIYLVCLHRQLLLKFWEDLPHMHIKQLMHNPSPSRFNVQIPKLSREKIFAGTGNQVLDFRTHVFLFRRFAFLQLITFTPLPGYLRAVTKSTNSVNCFPTQS